MSLPRFPEFTTGVNWNDYRTQVSGYFTASAIIDANQQKMLLISHLPADILDLVCALIGLEGLASASVDDVYNALSRHFKSNTDVPLQRRNFYRRDRRENESIYDYANALKVLAEHCDFREDTSKHLCSMFVMGINHEAIQEMLNKDDTFGTLVKRATAMFCAFGGSGGVSGGCDWITGIKGSSLELDQHMEIHGTKHLEMTKKLLKTHLTTQTKKVQKHKTRIAFLLHKTRQQDKVIQTLQLRVFKQQKRNAVLQAGQEKLIKDVRMMNSDFLGKVKELEFKPFVWCVTKISARIAEALANPKWNLFSGTFSASHNGFLLEAQLYLNECNKNKLTVYVFLRPGPCDALLKWPFRHTISFEVFSQNGGSTFRRSFTANPLQWDGCRSPAAALIGTGQGFDMMSLDALQKYYVKDDKLFIKIQATDK